MAARAGIGVARGPSTVEASAPGRSAADRLIRNPEACFAGFVLAHIVVWTTLPMLVTHSLPVDLLEGVIWGQGWQLGYDQPPFQAWLLGAVDWLSGYQRWAVYLSSQLLIAIGFWAVWRLSRLIVAPLGALVAVVLLEGVLFFNYCTPNLFPDLIVLPFWALATWSSYRCLRFDRRLDWVLLGLCLAGAAYAKYVSAILAAVMIGFLIVEPRARRSWRTPGPYLCAGICLLLLTPHLGWGIRRGFPTIDHFHHSARPTLSLATHAVALTRFAAGELAMIALVGVLVLALRSGRRVGQEVLLAGHPSAFDRRFVATLALGPSLLTLFAAAASGLEFRPHWCYAMWSFIGLFAVVFLAPYSDPLRLQRLSRAWAGVFLAAALLYASANGIVSHAAQWGLARSGARHFLYRLQREADFPGPEVAAAITVSWHEKVGGALPYVVGSKWLAGNISFFSKDHPLVLRDGDPGGSPWIDLTDLRLRGGVVVWDTGHDGDGLSGQLQSRFATLEMQPDLIVPWHTDAAMSPLHIRWGILRPLGEPTSRTEQTARILPDVEGKARLTP